MRLLRSFPYREGGSFVGGVYKAKAFKELAVAVVASNSYREIEHLRPCCAQGDK